MAQTPISIETAVRSVISQVLRFAPAGMVRFEGAEEVAKRAAMFNGGFDFGFERPGWAVNGQVLVGFKHRSLDADDKNKPWSSDCWEPYVRVKWSTSEWCVAGALAVVKLHQEVVEFAGLVEHTLNSLPPVLWSYDKDVPKKLRKGK